MIPLCVMITFGLAAAGLSWSLFQAFSESAKSYADTYEDEMSRTLEALFLFIPAKRLVSLGTTLAAIVFCLVMIPFCQPSRPWLIVIGVGIAGGVAAGAFKVPKWVVLWLAQRRRERFNLQLLEALPMMANALRAGFSIQQAFESVVEGTTAPMRQEIGLFLQQMRVGMSFYEALAALSDRVASEDMTLVCTAIDIARRTGGNLTEIFDTIAATIRGRLRLHQHVKTLTAQGRLQGIIIGLMPFLLGIGMTIFKPGLMLPFLGSLVGILTVLAVCVLVGLGAWMIRRIVTIDI